MKIGIIGAGNVGGTLGKRWAANGHEVIWGGREPGSDAMKALGAEAGPNARAATVAETAQAAEVVLLATPWPAVEAIVKRLTGLHGKILADATNPLLPNLEGLDIGTTTSAGEKVAEWAPGAKVVKAFNTVGSSIMANPSFGDEKPVLFYCGDDTDAKATVANLAVELGFDAQDAGPLKQARVLEPFALLWISLAIQYGYGTGIGFKFLRR